MKMERKIGIYLRVSTTDQSMDLQRAEILQFLKARGWSSFEVYEDSGKTGTNGNRPALKKLLQDARVRNIDLVICWKLDRLFRSLKDLVNTLQEFEELGVEFISLKDNIDLTTASGRLLMQVIGAMAEFECALIKERVRAGLKNAKANGKRLGRPTVIDATEVVEMRGKGYSLATIANAIGATKSGVSKTLRKSSLTVTQARAGVQN
ncbi:MAG: recombinase family protein [Deltaproteobacteria bacterium]|nr:recombinase family protein [Deltaproteobacteria bacterium]